MCGTDQSTSGKELGYAVVTKLMLPVQFEGYQISCNILFSLFCDLLENGIAATGTLRTNHMGILKEVHRLKEHLDKKHVQSGTGFYIRSKDSRNVCIHCMEG